MLSEWLKSWMKSQGTLKPTTKQIYKSHIDNYINPNLGKIPLKKLNGDILQGFINDLNLSASTVKNIFSILKSVLSSAEDNGLILNIWDKVKVPKKEKSIVQVLTINEQKLLESVLTSPLDIGVWICLYAGLRIGEVCALKWLNINFETLTLTVNGTQARTENGVEIIAPKSKSSKREIPIKKFRKRVNMSYRRITSLSIFAHTDGISKNFCKKQICLILSFTHFGIHSQPER